MELPGGLIFDGQLRREFKFKPITGQLERTIIDSGTGLYGLVTQVTNILAHALESIAGMVANEALVLSLCSGDRHYLIQQLEARIQPNPKWFTFNCNDCEEPLQIQLMPGSLPIKSANTNFPKISVVLSIGEVEARVPTGKDEQAIFHEKGDKQSRLNVLLKRLVTQSGHAIDINHLSDKDQYLLDKTLEDMMPQQGNSITTECPYCNQQQHVEIDTYSWLDNHFHDLDNEIHTLAINYHWSEKEILSLPRKRRKRYLDFIEKQTDNTIDDYMEIGQEL
jgi:hypothetical protein